MEPRERAVILGWAVFCALVATSALAVLASRASELLAVGVGLAGTSAALLLAWAAQPAVSSPAAPVEREREEHPKAA